MVATVDLLESRALQAVIARSFLAAGWLVNGRAERRAARRLRAERLRDAHRAIFAEIDANLSNLVSEEALRAAGQAMADRMAADDAFVPFIPRIETDRIFRALEGEIHILPRVTIDPIVRYYAQAEALSAHVEDMRGLTFKDLPQARRSAIYADYIEMKVAALALGRRANRLIEVYARDGKTAAEDEAARLSSLPAGDRSGR